MFHSCIDVHSTVYGDAFVDLSLPSLQVYFTREESLPSYGDTAQAGTLSLSLSITNAIRYWKERLLRVRFCTSTSDVRNLCKPCAWVMEKV